MGKPKFSRLSWLVWRRKKRPPHVEFLQTQIHFVWVNELLSFPPSLFFFFSFRVAHKLLTTHTVLRAVHTAQSVYHSQLMLKINLQHRYSKLWQIVMCWHSHKLLVKKSNTSLFCHLMFETRDGHIMQSLRVCKLHKCLGFTKQARLWKFFLLLLGVCLLPKDSSKKKKKSSFPSTQICVLCKTRRKGCKINNLARYLF